MRLRNGLVAYLIDSDFAIFTLRFRIEIGICSCIGVLREIDRGAAPADSIVKEHAVPLKAVKEEVDGLPSIGQTHIVFARIYMQSDHVRLRIANVLTHAYLWHNRAYENDKYLQTEEPLLGDLPSRTNIGVVLG